LKNKINQENKKIKIKIAIKIIRIKLDIKVKWNKILRVEIEKKINLKKHQKQKK